MRGGEGLSAEKAVRGPCFLDWRPSSGQRVRAAHKTRRVRCVPLIPNLRIETLEDDLEVIRAKEYGGPRRERKRGADHPHVDAMNLRNLKEVDTGLVGMIYLMRRAVTTRDDGRYEYAGRTGFALLTRTPRRGPAPRLTLF